MNNNNNNRHDDLRRRIRDIIQAASQGGNVAELVLRLLVAHPYLTYDTLRPLLGEALVRRSGYDRMCRGGQVGVYALTHWLELVMGMMPEDLNVGSVDEEEEANANGHNLGSDDDDDDEEDDDEEEDEYEHDSFVVSEEESSSSSSSEECTRKRRRR